MGVDLSEPELMTRGEVYEVTVPMSVTSNVFMPGHRIRLDVSGSKFPHYDRNSNTGRVISSEALEDMVVADTTIHHGGVHPSRPVLGSGAVVMLDAKSGAGLHRHR